MNHGNIDTIVSYMAPSIDTNIQRVQTGHRLKLAEFWNIKEGSKVLEIGCGQGDTSAVLAYLVGGKGFVHAIDIASPTYGSPVTLGDSFTYLKNSSIGERLQVNFNMDILSGEVDFPDNHFDVIVLSHCSWYLKSVEELMDTLKMLRKWGRKLCFAEWDARFNTLEQYPHFLSVLIQAQYECFMDDSLSNVRTLFTPDDVKACAGIAGWQIKDDATIDSPELQDGKWEIDHVLSDFQIDFKSDDSSPSKFRTLLESQINLLEASIQNSAVKPLSIFAFIAE